MSESLEFDGWYKEHKHSDKPLTYGIAKEAWNHQQKKIDAVLKYLDGCECSLDVDIDSIKELLK